MTHHLPVEMPVGPWECIDRACEEYEDPQGNDRPEVIYCSHLTVLILCEACAGWTEDHAVKNEATWAECTLRDEMRGAAAKLHDLAKYITGESGELAYLADPVAQLLAETANYTHPMTASQRHLWKVAAATAFTTNGKEPS